MSSDTAPPLSKPVRCKPKILIVDDEPIMLRSVHRILKRAHPEWQLVTAHSGESALALLERRTFDVMVTDLRMIGMQGQTLLELVRSRHPTVMRIIHSAHIHSLPPDDPDHPLAHRRIEKPCSSRELVDAVEWALETAAGRKGDNSACS